jgi:DNA-binding PadR family transcriptional regulator
MSGKEIIDKAIDESGGIWKPSPGLIYPMLGRLIEEGLIDQMDDGRYKITIKGLDMIKDLESVHNIFQKTIWSATSGRQYWQVHDVRFA